MTDNEKNIINKIENSFVENYSDMIIYRDTLNEILYKLNFDGFKSYNDFCKKIRKKTIDKITKDGSSIINEKLFFSIILNDIMKDEIMNDIDYENKLMLYFDDINLVKIINGTIKI
jgi:hypothetical protein